MRALEKISSFANSTFALWVVLFSLLSFLYPSSFVWISDYISILLGIIMFGMGLTLSLNDFKAVFKQPKSVLIGVVGQYTIMPGLAYGLAVLFQLPPEVAIGVILVGCCPGGTASNVMTYLAKGNTALSVAVTSVATLIAPFLTPVLIMLFASQWLEVSASSLLVSILKIVLLPIILGIIVKLLFKNGVEKSIKALPLISVIGIVAVAAGVVAVNAESIADAALKMIFIVMLHNLFGLFFGWLLARLFRLDEGSQKALSIEVGMQNSGLGAALALAHFSPIAAVPSAIFSVWHNISGPLLATYWGKKHDRKEKRQKEEQKHVV
ncbi:bile acid:sodium symporter family protein [Priestia endophytica]|uniref:Bile acid:Na+ symporter, BASS family n=1 Tax=Priestia endophytica DSM 13796 TaxID=1121089 RepID=A0A1I6AE69_9BACI|nr:bile acid:sodium symporter family protein [Priestia endophytica]KYG27410.1 sodium transporter [Priestia endophytica]MBG9814442.1 sodium transporter [Priestia endophytica]SFQ67008.1 bile acid:Na+ symporter, BASS family [Priestia endophytica DSM 13796]